MFIGVDLVEDRETRKPATELGLGACACVWLYVKRCHFVNFFYQIIAKKVVDEMKQRGVLISRDGPCDNVLKIKPPIVLSYSGSRVIII